MASSYSIDLISGLRPKNGGSFPLVNAKDVEYAADGRRLDVILAELLAGGGTGENGKSIHAYGKAVPENKVVAMADLSDSGNVQVGDLVISLTGSLHEIVSKDAENCTLGDAIAQLRGPKGDKGDQGEVGPTGPAGAAGAVGPKGDPGEAFTVAKTYPTIEAMNAGYADDGVKEGQFVVIESEQGADDPDNAKLYMKGAKAYTFITDLSGAAGITGPAGAAGAKGDKGDKGDAGAAGKDGQTPNFEVRDGHLFAIFAE